ncbi:MAG: VOC family protein [Pseudomonadota bacterium]
MIQSIAMFPVLVVSDLGRVKAFYETHFGFVADFFQEDFYLHLRQPDSHAQLAFMVPNHPSQPGFLQRPASVDGMVISLEVKVSKDAHEKAREAGMEMVLDYREEEFGVAHFMVKDPSGLVIDIVEHLPQEA